MLDFDGIFGHGEFDGEDNTYVMEFLGVEAGGTRNVLDFEVLKEHSERNGHEFEIYPNGASKDLRILNGSIEAEVENIPNGITRLELSFDEDIDLIQPYMENSVDQWLGEIIRREQKVYKAATHFVHEFLPRKADKQGVSELEVLEQELGHSGEKISDFHDSYRKDAPNGLAQAYGFQFELWPYEDSDMNRSDLPGKMPFTDELDDPDLRDRNDLYQRKFLDAVLKEAEEEYGLGEGLRHKWLEYSDSGFRKPKV